MSAAIGAWAAKLGLPAPGYRRRLVGYLREMFPLRLHGTLVVLLYANLAWIVDRELPHSAAAGAQAAVAVLSMLALALLMRLMDEIKDKALDARHYPQRPLPAGRVTEADLRATQLIVVLLFVALAATSPPTLVGGLGLLGYALALGRHLLLRRFLEPSPLLTLLTHAPFVPATLLYILALIVTARAIPAATLRFGPIAATVGMLWALVTTAEIARKIRAPSEESGYPTYSAAWGRRVAVNAALVSASTALAAAVLLVIHFARSPLMAVPGVLGFVWFATRCYRFRQAPAREYARLGAAAQVYGFAMLAAFAADAWLTP